MGEHIHVGTCFPHAQTVKGVVDFDIRVMLHENSGTAYQLRIAVGSTVLASKAIAMSCATDCTQWHRLSLDTAKWAYDGRQELRSAVTGVDCATGHTLGVVAFDSAGNRSGKSTRSVRCVWTAG